MDEPILSRRQKLIKTLISDYKETEKINELMRKLDKEPAGTYTQAEANNIHAQFLALQAKHERTLAEYYKMIKPPY